VKLDSSWEEVMVDQGLSYYGWRKRGRDQGPKIPLEDMARNALNISMMPHLLKFLPTPHSAKQVTKSLTMGL
jgi:hypothetical protein